MPRLNRALLPLRNNKTKLDFLCKSLLVGDPTVGHKALMRRYKDLLFSENSLSTLNKNFTSKELIINGLLIANQIWNTCDHKSTKPPYNFVDTIILTFDLSNPLSFSHLEMYLRDIATAERKKPILLVGTKSDKEKQVSPQLIEKFIRKLRLNFKFYGYFETSAKDDINVNEVFESAAKAHIIDSVEPARKPIILALEKYIKGIEKNKHKNSNSPDFGHGFWFFTKQRMANRKANYLLALSLLQDLYTRDDCSIAEIFSNLKGHRDDIIETESIFEMPDFVNNGMNSTTLKRIFNKVARDIALKTNPPKMPHSCQVDDEELHPILRP
ncbi:MAG: GTP-binding protein [Proteobacteria bacterium]|nr:GTP-binding protein [Pseudomonadota bacterium]